MRCIAYTKLTAGERFAPAPQPVHNAVGRKAAGHNAQHPLHWTPPRPPLAQQFSSSCPARLQVDAKLRAIMHSIYRTCKEVAEEYHTSLAAGEAGADAILLFLRAAASSKFSS